MARPWVVSEFATGTGPHTEVGLGRVRAARTAHGGYSAASQAVLRRSAAFIAETRALLASLRQDDVLAGLDGRLVQARREEPVYREKYRAVMVRCGAAVRASPNRRPAADTPAGGGGTSAFATLSVSLAAVREKFMSKLHYKVVEHDGGWAYRLNDVFSEPFHDKAAALAAARRVAKEQHVPGDTTRIEYQDADGKWHTELSEGDDRPDVDVES